MRLWKGRRLKPRIQVVKGSDGVDSYTFHCSTELEVYRATSLQEKEAGTVKWLHEALRPGQVVYDIGANIGIYTLIAAQRVGTGGRVYAFEPHSGNVISLMRNIGANAFGDRVQTFSCALNDRPGFMAFNYKSIDAGSSMSQLGATVDDMGREFAPKATEMKFGTSIDELISQGLVADAHHIKIDVDGNELLILRGMEQLLRRAPPESIQVEISPVRGHEIVAFMQEHGYNRADRHDTADGKRHLAGGRDPKTVPHNLVFRRAEQGR